ncbi:MAG: RNA polymerase sigma factor [Bacteroidales bacterium]|nr:RNA polymerase sigma factor [Bacteroidales bacterium]
MTAISTDIHKELINKSIQGNSKAMYELYRLYSKAIFNTCFRIMNNKEDAEDMLQEVFCEVFRKLHQFRFESTFGAWMKRIAVNMSINEIKKRKTELVFLDEFSDTDFADENNSDNEEEVEYTVEMVLNALEHLSAGSRMVFSLYMLEGYQHNEIAAMLSISESTSKNQLLRAKNKIKSILELKINK